MSARTDGRAPVMPVTGLPYGENQAVNAQQSAAPMGAPPAGGGGAPGGGGRPMPAMGPEGIFGGTERPGEAMTAGVPMGPGAGGRGGVMQEDPIAELRAIYAAYPTPGLRRLIERADQRLPNA